MVEGEGDGRWEKEKAARRTAKTEGERRRVKMRGFRGKEEDVQGGDVGEEMGMARVRGRGDGEPEVMVEGEGNGRWKGEEAARTDGEGGRARQQICQR
jgi:hypothetical protein